MIMTLCAILLMAILMVQAVQISHLSQELDILEARQAEVSEHLANAEKQIRALENDGLKELDFKPLKSRK